ncbi:response regulator transcription factor [Methylobacterium aerolatum]|uniref:DNA-binding response OmpR family regulator n=1 Tax=Methylobacterium aerolatum TaxID=418708 RepID=A0ABU0I2E7_9HYPH|nr:response regulator transcription factor [Methylobacterium aerolatum]MDQ0448772.1 DNA-binding response OmpR family regulator [Methylobacterium aerolatum]GJD34044.1 Transcriptional regulatory protein QseB [Methylobacterium aerolatum]
MRVLVVEDDPQLGAWLKATLSEALGHADVVDNLDEALAAVSVQPFDLVVLDRRLPDGDGITLIARLAQLRPRPGVLMLTAFDDPVEIARALDAGADDYVPKPFEPVELVARARAVIRRLQVDRKGVLRIGNLSFDTAARSVSIEGHPVPVPRRELALLEALIRRAGQVTMRETLEAAAYGFDDEIQSNAIDAHISRLRKRLRAADCSVAIKPLRGLGYVLEAG